METLSNVTSGVSKIVFGEQTNESNTEPVSGKTGKGTVDEPYDQGNREDGPTSPVSPTTPGATIGPGGPAEENQPQSSAAATGVDAAIKEAQKEDELEKKALNARDPNDHSGEALRVHDGSEAKDEKEGDQTKEGTGTKHVKSSGFSAEGGDFDATQPGAGKEADRLLEEKGVKTNKDEDRVKEDSPAPSSLKGASSVSSTPTKRSMSKRIKNKLHIGKKDKE